MLFAAGIGSRLGKITENTPKSLVEVGGKPMLEHVLLRLKEGGVKEVVINLFHLSEQIEAFLKSKEYFGIQVSFSKEQELLGTGGGLKHAAKYFAGSESFFIYNCDIYCELDLNDLHQFHKLKPAIATLVTMKRETSRYLYFDESGALQGWFNSESAQSSLTPDTSTLSKLAFSGIHIASPEIFKYMESESGNFSIITAYLNAVKSGQRVQCFNLIDQYWIDMGKPESLEKLKSKFSSAK